MNVDWLRFLEENNIDFATRGPNTKRGEYSVKCPFCGDDDPSTHLGINPKSGKWGCLRDSNHRGKTARHLIKAILSCSSQQAQLIVRQYSKSDPDSLEAALAVLEADGADVTNHDEDLAKQAKHQRLGPQFNDFSKIKVRGITRRFFDYLRSRGYDNPQEIIEQYNLRCALTGRYKDRIIIPVTLNEELMGWTSRAIGAPKNAPRYLASSEDVKTTVFNFDELKAGGERLFIVEGPFDAIRVDFAGTNIAFDDNQYNFRPDLGNLIAYRATCTFGTSVTVSQLALLRALRKKFDQTWVLFDRGAERQANELSEWVGAKLAYLPSSVEDPGELALKHLARLASHAFDGWIDFFR